ncbi:MAG: hypothetical protein IT238_06280 [Bacteroidia bacterium]|nr:hypothetical protein [Bacteroidia bacterium]MCZ2249860.1 hypothetical protein [Bacteroidia bacterium]
MNPSLLIIGGGSHGKVVYETAKMLNQYSILGFADNNLAVGSTIIDDAKVLCTPDNFFDQKIKADCFIVAIGDNKHRNTLYHKYKEHLKPATILHPSAVISNSAKIGPGTVVLANAVINTMSTIGENCIIGVLSFIDHESLIDNHVYIKPMTAVTNKVHIPEHFTSNVGQIITSAVQS